MCYSRFLQKKKCDKHNRNMILGKSWNQAVQITDVSNLAWSRSAGVSPVGGPVPLAMAAHTCFGRPWLWSQPGPHSETQTTNKQISKINK